MSEQQDPTLTKKQRVYLTDLVEVQGVIVGGVYMPNFDSIPLSTSDMCIVTSVTIGVNCSFVTFTTDCNSTAKELELEKFKADYVIVELSRNI